MRNGRFSEEQMVAITGFPTLLRRIAHNNETRVELRMATDVITAIRAADHVVDHVHGGLIEAEQ